MPIINTFNPSAAVNVTTDEITIPSHNFLPINGIVYSNGGGTSIGGLVEGFKYYIIYVNANTVKLATTEDNARNNIAVDLLSVGSGTLHTISESYVFPNSSAYYDFFRKVRLIGDGLPIEGVQLEAKSVRDTFTIIGGNNINFECDTVDISQAQFTINAPNYQFKFLTGTSDLRLFNDAGFDQSVKFKAGTGVAITHNSLEEIEITSFGVTESDTIQTVTSRGNITNNRILMNDITVAEIVSTPGIDGVTTSACVTANTTSDSITGDGTLNAPVRFANLVNSSSELNETVTVTFTVPNPGTLSYAASYIAESAVLTTGSIILEREDPLNPGTFVTLDAVSGTAARTGYNVQGIYAELSGPVNYRLIWDWTGNTSFVRLSFSIYFEVEPIAGFEMIVTNTASKLLALGVDDGLVTVRGPSVFTGYIDTQGLRIFQNNIVGTGSNDDIVVDLNGTGALELRATTFNTNETTFNLIDIVATTVNAFGSASTINIGADSGTLTVGNPTLVGTQTTQNVYDTVATTVNAFGAATAIDVGANSGTITINNPTLVGTQTTQNVYDTVATTVNAFGAATSINIGAATGTLTIGNETITGTNAIIFNMNGASPSIVTSSSGTVSVFNTNATTGNLFGAATTVGIGASSGTLTLRNPTVIGTETTQNVYNTVATTVNAFGAAATLNIGASSGTLTLRNPTVVGTETTQNVYNTVATTVNAFGAATTISIGAATGLTTINNSLTVTGDFIVNGNTTTLNVATLDVEDLNVTLALGSPNPAAANGAGLTIAGAAATLLYANADDSWNFNKLLKATSLENTPIGTVTRAAGNFTTLDANSTVGLSPANATVTISPTGTGTVTISPVGGLTINPTTLGTVNNVSIGATTASTGRFTTLQTVDTSTTAWDLTLASTSSTALTADRTLTFDVINSDRTIKLNGNIDVGGNITTANSFTTSGNFALTLTTTGITGVSLPTSGTLYGTAANSITSSELATSISDETGTGVLVFGTSPVIGTPDINGGTVDSLTSLSIRDTSAAFDVTLAATSTPALSANRTLTVNVENAARSIALGGNIDINGNLTTANTFTTVGNFALTLTATGITSVTLPTTGTLATLAGAESLTNKKLGSLTTNGLVTTISGDGTLTVTPTTGTGNAVLSTAPTISNASLSGTSVGNASTTADADATVDASTTTFYAYVQSASGTARTINISNLTAGRKVQLYLRNTNAATKVVNITASTTTTGFVGVNMATSNGAASATSVTLAATNGTAMITVFNANGTFAGGM